MPIAELFLSTVVDNLLSQLSSSVLSDYARTNRISDKRKKWQARLRMIQVVMDSAEERQIDGDPGVDQWLAELKEVAYDMEDLLDEFAVKAKRNVSRAFTQSANLLSRLISTLIPSWSRIDPCTLLSDREMVKKMEEVDRRLEEVYQQKDLLKLADNPKSRPPTISSQPRFTTTSLPEPKFVGRENQMKELLARLTGIEATDNSVRPFTVVSIVGMGGLGKTTLAQQLYHHNSVSEAFPVRAWTCVSDVFDRIAITKSILDCIAPSSFSSENKDLNWLQNSLKDQLSGKKFLIVLDDVWKEDYHELDSLLKPFYSGSNGSTILLTTRIRKVAELVGDCYPTQLGLLSSNECLSLLAYHAIGQESFKSHPQLQDIAVQLAEKCKGLPLAAKTIGGLLRFEMSENKWKEVLDHGIWKREGEREKIPAALKLSYVHLPIHLKRCFAACALFPKDYLFDTDELIRLWIAQGLLRKGTAKTYRDVGMDCLCQLESRSLLEKAGDEKTWYSMHDLINDLAKSVVGATYFISDEYRGTSSEGSLAKVRHAAMVTQLAERCPASRVEVYHPMKNLRTFMPFQISIAASPNVSVSNKVIHDLIMDLKNLRMLSLRYFRISKVPDKIGELKLLRSIDFSYTNVEVLPESVCELVQLQSLLLRGCYKLKKLPRNIHKLTNLIQLDIAACSLEEMPPHIGDLTNLEILSDFVVGKEDGRALKELRPLKCLQRDLRIHNLQEVDNVGDAGIANLKEKEGIFEFSFDWGSKVGISHDDEKLLDHLEPPSKVKCIAIQCYGGKKFSSWFGNPHMNNVVSITLAGCNSVESLPSFGQLPSLERLSIVGLGAVCTIGAEFYGMETTFRSLRYLCFRHMIAWDKWSSCEDGDSKQPFPRLCELTMTNCRKLKRGLPGRLDSLFKLEIRDCPILETSGGSLSLPSLCEMHFESSNEGLLKYMVDVTSLTKLTICNVPQLVHFDESFTTSWVALEEIQIGGCPRFTSFVDGDGGKRVPLKLKKLVLRECGDLEKLPDDLSRLTSLIELTVSCCEKLSSFPSAGLPIALSKLELKRCPKLPPPELISTRLPESLKKLFLGDLTGLVSVTGLIDGSRLSRSLRELTIQDCSSLTTLPGSLQNLSGLSGLIVSGCEALELECFPALPCNISGFWLLSCPGVKSLPHDMHNLTSLKEIQISSCDGITCLPRGGLPPNLGSLKIGHCRKLNQLLEEWGLSGLTHLRELIIWGEMECLDEMVCFPSTSADDHDAWLRCLPSSLVELTIAKMKKLERLAGGLRTCLTSLYYLSMVNCERLRHLPGDGLPVSLESLCIEGCPLLEERCSEPNGDYWPLLQLIPGLG